VTGRMITLTSFIYLIICFQLKICRAIVQAVSRWLPTAPARFEPG
jgi:hypothetical protein